MGSYGVTRRLTTYALIGFVSPLRSFIEVKKNVIFALLIPAG